MVGASERRQFVTAEHADQRHVAERLPNIRGIYAGNTVEGITAGTTVEVQAESRGFSFERLNLPAEHLTQVLARALAVAHRKNHRLTFADRVRDCQHPFFRIQTINIAHQILAWPDAVLLTIRRESNEQNHQGPADIFGQ